MKSPVTKREVKGKQQVARFYPIQEREKLPRFQKNKQGKYDVLPVAPVGWVLGIRSRTTSFATYVVHSALYFAYYKTLNDQKLI